MHPGGYSHKWLMLRWMPLVSGSTAVTVKPFYQTATRYPIQNGKPLNYRTKTLNTSKNLAISLIFCTIKQVRITNEISSVKIENYYLFPTTQYRIFSRCST